MNVLVTGGSGFIGSRIVEFWARKGARVYVIDIKPFQSSDDQVLERTTIIQGDISDPKSFTNINHRIDKAYHLAAQTSAQISEENNELDISTNIKGTLTFCQWADMVKPSHIVYTSSMAVYGSHGDNIHEDSAISPCSLYGITKYTGELLIRRLSSNRSKVTTFRLFNVYGPGQDLGNLTQGMVSIYIAHAIKDHLIRVTGSLDRYRDFVFIDDVVSALTIDESILRYSVYNVGSGRPVRVKDLISVIQNALGDYIQEIQVIESSGHLGDVFGNYACINRISDLGWSSTVSLEAGIKEFCDNAIIQLAPSSSFTK